MPDVSDMDVSVPDEFRFRWSLKIVYVGVPGGPGAGKISPQRLLEPSLEPFELTEAS